DPFEGPHRGFEVPGPIAALDGISIVGGLAYTSALVPGTGRLGLWINAVMVIPQYRRQGIATELIRHALAKAALTTHNRLYVFTDRPELYKGWKLLQQLDGSSIFHTTIVR
ncbi:MAG: GNAT family N-acetyltransferase, partial [Gammaproteobacteria bacterium]